MMRAQDSLMFTQSLNSLQGLMRNIMLSADYSYVSKNLSKALLDAMRPVLSNPQIVKVQMDGIQRLATTMANAIDIQAVNESMTINILNIQKTFANVLKDYDFSHFSISMSQMSSLLKEIYDIQRLEFTDADEEHQIEFETDVKEIADENNQQNWQQKFVGTLHKWRAKNPILAFILTFVIFQMILMMIYDTAKYMLIKPSQATIREHPSANAEVVIRIERHEIVTVIESQPYWVKVIYLNAEEGEIHEGWLPKRVCEEIEDEDNDEECEITGLQSETVETEYEKDMDETHTG